jgi:hypothetical protein
MNAQLPSIDPGIRDHLARRSDGRVPEGLLAEIGSALDSVPRERPRRFAARRIWRTPRALAAAACLVLVAALAVGLFGLPALNAPAAPPAPAGYPAGRALTTSELAAVMAGPALKVNAALVASVTIDSRTDVCPMNRYPTIGVVEGMSGQVCVMAATLAAEFAGPRTTGTFAFRYLAPGVLGLLGQITPASDSHLAFHASDPWPASGHTFLVEAWLGSSQAFCPARTYVPGDPLDPAGDCDHSWLADYVDAAGSPMAHASSAFDDQMIRLFPTVNAYGARFYDAIPPGTPIHGVYVVDSDATATGCGLPPCDIRRVLANLADISVPSPSESAVAVASPSTPAAVDQSIRVLTTPELGSLLAGRQLAVGAVVVASVTIDEKACLAHPDIRGGVLEGLTSQVCLQGDPPTLPKIEGTFAFRYVGPGLLENLGQLESAAAGRLLFRVADNWPGGITQSHTFLATGCLAQDATGTEIVQTAGHFPPPGSTFSKSVIVDPDAGIDRSVAACGVFIVTSEWFTVPASSGNPQGDGIAFHVRAMASDLVVVVPTPTPAPSR